MSFLEAVHPEDRATLSLILRGQAGRAVSGELRIVRPNGEVVWIGCRTSAVEDASGRARRLVLVAEEITERKEAALATAARLKELEHRNAELDAFAHTAAHNLRSAPGPILGNAKLLESLAAPRLEAEDRGSLQDLVEMADRASRVVEDLLLLSKVDTNGPQCEPLHMQRIVENALARLAPRVVETDARISPPAGWPPVLGYAAWVEEVWVSYLDNAVRYGGLQPHIELGSVLLGDRTVRFYVRDHGPGILEPDLTRLFQPFIRLSPTSGEGHGLGLTIVKRIVERLGGEAAVESVLSEGSTFSFTLPGL
jgi:two-component system, sensor histidine kinase and response regulator